MSQKEERTAKLMVDSKLKAVHDDDLSSLLISLNVYDDVCEGRCICHFCNQLIILDNISSIFPYENEVGFCCNTTECILNLMKLGTSKGKEHATA